MCDKRSTQFGRTKLLNRMLRAFALALVLVTLLDPSAGYAQAAASAAADVDFGFILS
jgi:hypothetical protein